MSEVIHIVSAIKAQAYDGTNGAAIVAEFNGTVLSDDGVTLVFHAENAADSPREATVGQFVMWRASSGDNAVFGVVDEMPPFYVQVPPIAP